MRRGVRRDAESAEESSCRIMCESSGRTVHTLSDQIESRRAASADSGHSIVIDGTNSKDSKAKSTHNDRHTEGQSRNHYGVCPQHR